jgi:outer membrane protein TolC
VAGRIVVALWVAVGFVVPAASAQTARPLSLEQALALAERASEAVAISRVGVTRAEGQQLQLRSGLLPQLSANLSYVRTLRSQFQDLARNAAPPAANTNASGSSSALDSLVSRLPFGQPNQYSLGLSFSQTLFSAPLIAQTRAAAAAGRAAAIELASTRAQLVLDVAQAYYDAALADRLVEIADATLQQAEVTLQQVTVAFRVGNRPEFDVLRARVARDTERPVLIQQQAQRDIAYVRLRQLVQLPADEPIALTDALDDASTATARTVGVAGSTIAQLAPQALAEVDERAPVREAGEAVTANEHAASAAKAERLPSVGVSSQYQRLAYPVTLFPTGDFVTNWTVGVSAQVPILSGGRIRADAQIARGNLDEARLTLSQVRKIAELDTRDTLARLQAAEATWEASSGTVEQAVRAFQIAQVRYREGVSTQTELADAQLLFEQAQANRATAARDVRLAHLRVKLLRDLPFTAGSNAGPSLRAPAPSRPAAPSTPQTPAAPRSSAPQPLNASSQSPIGPTMPGLGAQGIRP